jgi:hypothetical protein
VSEEHRVIGIRTWIAALLGVGAAALFVLDSVLPAPQIDPSVRVVPVRPDLRQVNDLVDALFADYGIKRPWIRTWQVHTPDRKFVRIQRRVYVPPEFVSPSFNLELNRRLAEYGARAIATERTKENTVTMHIMKDRTVVESISFVVKRGLQGRRA